MAFPSCEGCGDCMASEGKAGHSSRAVAVDGPGASLEVLLCWEALAVSTLCRLEDEGEEGGESSVFGGLFRAFSGRAGPGSSALGEEQASVRLGPG